MSDHLDTVPGQLGELSKRLDDRDQEIQRQFAAGSARFTSLEAGLAENTAATKRIDERTALQAAKMQPLLEIAEAAGGAIKVLNWIGKLARPMGFIDFFASSAVGFYAAVKSLIGWK